MDEIVRQALAKWPDVPDCTGWLALDARGRWRIGDAKAGPRLPITHAAMNAFISRNYFSTGRYWIFQNGPQRVFVELEYTPFVWRLQPQQNGEGTGCWDLVAHTGAIMTPSSIWLDDQGRFLVQARSETGEPTVGVIHDHDTVLVAELLRDEDGNALDDEAISRMSSDTAPTSSSPAVHEARLHWNVAGATALQLPVHHIAAHQVATQFGFEPKPSLALRVDLDTRR